MQGRSRLLIIIAFIIVVVGVGAAFLLGRPPAPTVTPVAGDGTTVAQESTNTPQGPTATPQRVVCIVVAVQTLNRGLEIPANGIEIRYWPELSAPREAFLGIPIDDDPDNCGIPDGVVGKIARTDIQREQPILNSMVVDNLTDLTKIGSDAAAILPAGYVAVAVPMDRLTSVAYAIQPGDRVDIIVSMLFVDVDLEFQTMSPNLLTVYSQDEEGTWTFGAAIDGRPDTIPTFGSVIISPSEDQRPRLATQRTIQDALVIWVGDFPANGRLFFRQATPTVATTAEASPNAQQAARGTPVPPTTAAPRPDIVTLGVTPQDAVTLTWLIEAHLPITFALRSAKDTSKVPTDQVTLDYIMTQYRISLPSKLNYSIQPAIRSIRQIFAGAEIELDTQ